MGKYNMPFLPSNPQPVQQAITEFTAESGGVKKIVARNRNEDVR
jgi:hypothetical protein